MYPRIFTVLLSLFSFGSHAITHQEFLDSYALESNICQDGSVISRTQFELVCKHHLNSTSYVAETITISPNGKSYELFTSLYFNPTFYKKDLAYVGESVGHFVKLLGGGKQNAETLTKHFSKHVYLKDEGFFNYGGEHGFDIKYTTRQEEIEDMKYYVWLKKTFKK
ncbi:hypothetical protein L1D14_16825 [Vibrio tubiashii]|uniref:hypothetical protein n=1 Tax=Vibrio tubiashii TaxID=29498 RepID=UPI001EFE7F85|nr:hypothetical protein [Vibrio tubiashii]MCG9577879.1 hypothetical protein [Vibrio tubiashii]